MRIFSSILIFLTKFFTVCWWVLTYCSGILLNQEGVVHAFFFSTIIFMKMAIGSHKMTMYMLPEC